MNRVAPVPFHTQVIVLGHFKMVPLCHLACELMTLYFVSYFWSIKSSLLKNVVCGKTMFSEIISVAHYWRSFSEHEEYLKPRGLGAASAPEYKASYGSCFCSCPCYWWSFFSSFGRVRGRGCRLSGKKEKMLCILTELDMPGCFCCCCWRRVFITVIVVLR